MKPQHRISLKSLAEDLLMDVNMHVDMDTGALSPHQTDSSYDYERDHYTVSIDTHDLYDDDCIGDNINKNNLQKMMFTKKSSKI